jgi:cytochrome P450
MTTSVSHYPAGHFLLGNLREFNADTLAFLLKSRRYGHLVKFRFGPFQVYIANDPDLIHDVLVTHAAHFYKTTLTKQVFKPTIGEGLFVSDGELWKRQRKLAQPAFHSKRIANYADVMVKYAAEMVESWQPDSERDIEFEMAGLTMRIISKTLFDADVAGETKEISDTVAEVLRITNERFNRFFLLPTWLPTPENRAMKNAAGRLNTLIQRFIEQRRKSGEDKGDLLSMLLMAQEEDGSSMSDEQVMNESKTLFGAGHETTAVALTWAWYLLSQHPDVEAKLQAELDTVLGGRLPTFDDLARLPYTDMIIKETLRLYPPAWATTREVHEKVTIAGEMLPKQTVIIINIYGVQRDGRFFENPKAFIPERFSAENEKRIPKYAYLPFGGGPRVCIGNMFAMMEARLILATMAQKLRLSLKPGLVVEPQRVFTLRPKYGMKMIVKARETLVV